MAGAGGAGQAGASAGAGQSGAGGGGAAGQGGASGAGGEACDGKDNDGNGKIDEGCTCGAGQKQQCYPKAGGPPEGCRWGEQVCSGSDWGGSACQGATLPPEGESACCTLLGETPKHPLYEAFLAAYPADKMPKTVDSIKALQNAPMNANGHVIAWSSVNVGNEIVDVGAGGVTAANLEKGRQESRKAAEAKMPPDSVIAAVKEEPVVIEGSGNGCDGVGWGWGSILYKTPDEAVSELIYLYIGYCNNGDIEAFLYSQEALQVCKPPVKP